MNNEPLLNVKCFLLDMDGTFNLGDELIDGSLYFIDTLRELGIDFLFLTNNSSKHRRLYAEKITRLGLPIPEEKVFTAGEATALVFTARTCLCEGLCGWHTCFGGGIPPSWIPTRRK